MNQPNERVCVECRTELLYAPGSEGHHDLAVVLPYWYCPRHPHRHLTFPDAKQEGERVEHIQGPPSNHSKFDAEFDDWQKKMAQQDESTADSERMTAEDMTLRVGDAPAEPPRDYKCSKCNTQGVKLWRQCQTFLEHIELLCFDCGLVDQEKSEAEIGDSDQIGWLVPAVPTHNETFWGYTSVPQERVDWWKRLPKRAAEPVSPAPQGDSQPQDRAVSLNAVSKALQFAFDSIKTRGLTGDAAENEVWEFLSVVTAAPAPLTVDALEPLREVTQVVRGVDYPDSVSTRSEEYGAEQMARAITSAVDAFYEQQVRQAREHQP